MERITQVVRGPKGEILNAIELEAAEIAHQKVLCPGCKDKIFASWPDGWDEHAAYLCDMPGNSPDARKDEFKKRYSRLLGAAQEDGD